MHTQKITDPYACVSYVTSYMSKGQRGLSNLLHQACKEARSSESDIRQQVRRIGNHVFPVYKLELKKLLSNSVNAFKKMFKVCCIH